MDKLFGIPLNQLLTILLTLFGLGTAVTAFFAWRNPVLFKTAVRNIPRRRSQTVLIILGLMLATLLFSAAFTTGDTLSHSIRRAAVAQFGLVDVQVNGKADEATGRLGYFDQDHAAEVRRLLADEAVAGVAPLIREQAPVVEPVTRVSRPSVTVLGIEAGSHGPFDPLVDSDGRHLSVADLSTGEVYASRKLAADLVLGPGDSLHVYLGSEAVAVRVAAVYDEGPKPAGDLSLVLSLPELQRLTGNDGRVNSIVITNEGNLMGGVEHVDGVLAALSPFGQANELIVASPKQSALKAADEAGSIFSSIFLLFGQFSIIAGILLIFLIFVMLAAERKRELGVTRAIGAQRDHVVRMFVYEGAMYALMAAAVGSLLGVAVGWGMVRVMAAAFTGVADGAFELVYFFNWRSLLIAYLLGMVFTFSVVLIASWRVSRLNIVRAVRDIPEPRLERRSIKGWLFTFLLLLVALLTIAGAFQVESFSLYMFGTSLLLISMALLAWRLGVPERIPFTLAGVALLYWWLVPKPELIEPLMPRFNGAGIEMFFLSGIMVVIGAVWTTVYNADLITAFLVFLFGNVRGLASVLRTAVAYSMNNRFRTGMTLAMFSLVIFTLVVMAFIINAVAVAIGDVDKLSGNFQVDARVSYTNPVRDMTAALESAEGLNRDDFEVVAGFTNLPVQVRQEGVEAEAISFFLSAANEAYLADAPYNFQLLAAGYESSDAVWQALRAGGDVVVVQSWLVPARSNFVVNEISFRLEGFYLEDEELPETFIEVTNPFNGEIRRLQVIGVLESVAFYAGDSPLLISEGLLASLAPTPLPPQSYLFRLRDGADAAVVARNLEVAFVEHGLQATVTAERIQAQTQSNLMINNLLQGFMSLGLVVGIAALGVITARSVVERRQQIGVLRAIGFQRSMVQFSFILESSFMAFLGITLGVLLGAAISQNVIEGMSEVFPGVQYVVPWTNLTLVVAVAYGASLLTSMLAARAAAYVEPAEALRYE
jgi:putative ABC transport system permease protein